MHLCACYSTNSDQRFLISGPTCIVWLGNIFRCLYHSRKYQAPTVMCHRYKNQMRPKSEYCCHFQPRQNISCGLVGRLLSFRPAPSTFSKTQRCKPFATQSLLPWNIFGTPPSSHFHIQEPPS